MCRQPAPLGRSHRPALLSRLLSPLVAVAALLPAVAPASEIAVNLRSFFNLQKSFADGIDTSLTVDPLIGAARLLGDRLGSFSGGSMALTLNSRHSISLNDPGVAGLPAAPRELLSVSASLTASGGLLAADVVQNLGAIWQCRASLLRCDASTQLSTLRTATPEMLAPASAAALLTPIRLQARATSTPLVDGVTLNAGNLLSSGSLLVQASFTAKTPTAYVADALQATTGAGGGVASARWGAAAADVRALRAATLTDLTVDIAKQIRRTPELEAAQRLLSVARDGAALLATGPTPGGSFATSFELTRQLWDVAALLDPALGRATSGSGDDNLFSSDRAAEIGVLRLLLDGADDGSFASGVAGLLAHPLATGPTAALTLDGARLGLAGGTTLSVYLVGDPSSGQAEVQLPGASQHALWRTGFDRLTLLDGPAGGLLIGGNTTEAGSLLTVEGGGVYVGEAFGGLLTLSGGTGRLQINNAYGDRVLVVASWGAAPVPEPGSALLLAVGLALVVLARRRRG